GVQAERAGGERVRGLPDRQLQRRLAVRLGLEEAGRHGPQPGGIDRLVAGGLTFPTAPLRVLPPWNSQRRLTVCFYRACTGSFVKPRRVRLSRRPGLPISSRGNRVSSA